MPKTEGRTLNQTWTLCLRMWKWIKKVWRTPEYANCTVHTLKRIWLDENDFQWDIISGGGCFFCDWNDENLGVSQHSCNMCPGKLVEPKFNCGNRETHYEHNPPAFYKELLRLNKIRKGK